MSRPGTRLLAIARLWFDESSITHVFEPLVADWQSEYASASGSDRRRIWFHGAIALVTTTVGVAGRSVRRELLVPPPVALTGALVGAAIVTGSAFALLVSMGETTPGSTPTILATLTLVVWAGLIWPPTPNRLLRERPLATYLKLSAVLLLTVSFLEGLQAVLVVAPLVPVWASIKLPLRRSRDELRRMGLVFSPLGAVAVMSPIIEPRFWPDAWVGVLYVCWGFWSVVACSLDATRLPTDEPRASLESGRL